MACVIAVQALVFSDGGLVVMGANIFNMGVVGHARRLRDLQAAVPAARRRGPRPDPRLRDRRLGRRRARIDCDVARADVSGTSPAEVVLPAMVGVHVFIGIGEALITAAALAFIAATRQDLLDLRPTGRPAWPRPSRAAPAATA